MGERFFFLSHLFFWNLPRASTCLADDPDQPRWAYSPRGWRLWLATGGAADKVRASWYVTRANPGYCDTGGHAAPFASLGFSISARIRLSLGEPGREPSGFWDLTETTRPASSVRTAREFRLAKYLGRLALLQRRLQSLARWSSPAPATIETVGPWSPSGRLASELPLSQQDSLISKSRPPHSRRPSAVYFPVFRVF